MHIKGTPKTMQKDPEYRDLFGEIHAFLGEAIRTGERNGVRQMLVDPGIGFGKTADDNYRLLSGLSRFADLGYPILVGPSRKSFLASASGLPVRERLEASLAAATSSVLSGAQIVRVHDVRETRRAVSVADAVRLAAR
jgi:dihydropteroate synthase